MKRFITLLSIIFLSACAPALDGSSAQRAVQWQPTETLNLSSAKTTYVSVTLPPAYFGYDDEDLKRFGKINIDSYDAVGTSHNRSVAREFALDEVSKPEGWQVSLERSYLVRKIEDRTTERTKSKYYRSTRTNTYYTEAFEFTFAVTLPPGVSEEALIMLTLQSREGTERIPLLVQPQTS